jgi:hypothetical protein
MKKQPYALEETEELIEGSGCFFCHASEGGHPVQSVLNFPETIQTIITISTIQTSPTT